jgi:hypothetical protein
MSIPIHEAEARNYSDLLWRCSIQKGVTTSVYARDEELELDLNQ